MGSGFRGPNPMFGTRHWMLVRWGFASLQHRLKVVPTTFGMLRGEVLRPIRMDGIIVLFSLVRETEAAVGAVCWLHEVRYSHEATKELKAIVAEGVLRRRARKDIVERRARRQPSEVLEVVLARLGRRQVLARAQNKEPRKAFSHAAASILVHFREVTEAERARPRGVLPQRVEGRLHRPRACLRHMSAHAVGEKVGFLLASLASREQQVSTRRFAGPEELHGEQRH